MAIEIDKYILIAYTTHTRSVFVQYCYSILRNAFLKASILPIIVVTNVTGYFVMRFFVTSYRSYYLLEVISCHFRQCNCELAYSLFHKFVNKGFRSPALI